MDEERARVEIEKREIAEESAALAQQQLRHESDARARAEAQLNTMEHNLRAAEAQLETARSSRPSTTSGAMGHGVKPAPTVAARARSAAKENRAELFARAPREKLARAQSASVAIAPTTFAMPAMAVRGTRDPAELAVGAKLHERPAASRRQDSGLGRR